MSLIFFCKFEFFPMMDDFTFVFFSLQPKLTMAKCRKNVENFLDACRKIGVGKVK